MKEDFVEADKAYRIGHKILSEMKEGSEDVDINNIKLPYIIKNHILMSPGNWNEDFYDFKTLEKAFNNTDWTDPDVTSLFLDHEDEKAAECIGDVKNPKLIGENLVGDIYVVDKDTAVKLAYGIKFGISPKIEAEQLADRSIKNARYLNFSVVFNPACKTTFLNKQINESIPKVALVLKQKNKGDNMEKELAFDMAGCVNTMKGMGMDDAAAGKACKAAATAAQMTEKKHEEVKSETPEEPEKKEEGKEETPSEENKGENKEEETDKGEDTREQLKQVETEIDKIKLEQKRQELESLKKDSTNTKELMGRQIPSGNDETANMTHKELMDVMKKSPEDEFYACVAGYLKRQSRKIGA